VKEVGDTYRATFYEGDDVVHVINNMTGPIQEAHYWRFEGGYGMTWAPNGVPATGSSDPTWAVFGPSGVTYFSAQSENPADAPDLVGCYRLTWASTLSGGGEGVSEDTNRLCLQQVGAKYRATFYEGTEAVHVLHDLAGPTLEFGSWAFVGEEGIAYAQNGVPALGTTNPMWIVKGTFGVTYYSAQKENASQAPDVAGCYQLTWHTSISGGGNGVDENTSRLCMKDIGGKYRATFYEGNEVVHVINNMTGPIQEAQYWRFEGGYGMTWAPNGASGVGSTDPTWAVFGPNGVTYFSAVKE
jgi:hypothetical protein